MGKKIQAMLESDTDCKEEIIDQPMLDIPKNTTCLALDGFESDSNSGNEAPNPGDGDFLMGFMTRVHLQPPMPFSMMIPTPICMHHHRRQKHLDSALKRWDATNTWEVDTSVKPLNVLFSSFLGNIAHDQMLKISLGNLVYDLHMAS
ncbi:uncharacterized protein LOC136065973 isoform X2 [Quercus suber]|uniref:uncharacterized protein LOC136065973 isoform X2 n=1 Tax=Quercus suber TaxID=58331 RepID=UPI0032E02F84